ncbi:hypothetical protein KPH14_013002, partial [Odynerus spinipes]
MIKNQGLTKGIKYFSNYHKDTPTPWFKDKLLNRELIVMVCRARSNHINLNESLHKIKVVPDKRCECGHYSQDLNHVLWQCQKLDVQRSFMIRELCNIKEYPPYNVECYLAQPNLVIMQMIYKFLTACDIKI